ncbi:hypothetical protein KGM_211307 [Danaus plexippus plexippus]|uniref:Uncharacterized protein n=1 Tax=Danaus plexippus plexippus TaxID=278856 RepID=A0A212FIM8_DANPL|nr:hypothetical protein KGM_211307 [Danaus plexippus plexippus]
MYSNSEYSTTRPASDGRQPTLPWGLFRATHFDAFVKFPHAAIIGPGLGDVIVTCVRAVPVFVNHAMCHRGPPLCLRSTNDNMRFLELYNTNQRSSFK